MATKRKANDTELRNYVGIRLTDEDIRRIESIIAHLSRGAFGLRVTRSEVIRLALQRGLEGLDEEG